MLKLNPLAVALSISFALPGTLIYSIRSGAAEPKPLARPTQTMRELESSLKAVLLDASSESKFNAPASRLRIQKNVDKLARIAGQVQSLKPGALAGDKDPTIGVIARLFSDQVQHARNTLKSGQRAYARSVLQGIPQYCVSCHSRTNSGPSFRTDLQDSGLSALEPFDQAQLYAATRRFDRALEIYEKILGTREKGAAYSPAWERSVRNSLAIAVRVSQDPEKASRIIQQVIENPEAPAFLRQQATQWKRQVDDWKKEPAPKGETQSEALIEQARQLIAQARSAQKYPADRSADILWLRASARLHDLLGKDGLNPALPEAMYLAGITYDVLQDLGLWNLQEFYFLSCIHLAPHTPFAEQCYQRYEENAFAAFSGSSGTHLPTDVKMRLQELSELAAPPKPQGPR